MTGQHVSLVDAALGSWAKPGESAHVLTMYDPDLIFTWIHNIWDQRKFAIAQQDPAPKTDDYLAHPTLIKRVNALGLQYDCTRYQPPTDPIWQGEAAKYQQ